MKVEGRDEEVKKTLFACPILQSIEVDRRMHASGWNGCRKLGFPLLHLRLSCSASMMFLLVFLF